MELILIMIQKSLVNTYSFYRLTLQAGIQWNVIPPSKWTHSFCLQAQTYISSISKKTPTQVNNKSPHRLDTYKIFTWQSDPTKLSAEKNL